MNLPSGQVSTKFHKNIDKRYKRLTDLVIEYQDSPSSKNFSEISKLTSKLVYNILSKYGLLLIDPVTLDDIKEDCLTIVLLKCLNSYDRNKGAAFSTHYTWWLRSYVQYKRKCYFRRSSISNAISIDKSFSEDNSKRTLSDVISNSTPLFTCRIKNEYHRWIDESKRYINYDAFRRVYNSNKSSFDSVQLTTA